MRPTGADGRTSGTPAPRVSVVIPTYRRAGPLKRALASVQAQTFDDFEVLVVENGPGHEGQAVVEAFAARDARFRYLHDPKPDPCNARNAGIRNARGAYIALLDDDDEWLPERLADHVAILDANPEVNLVASRSFVVEPDGTEHLDEQRDFRGVPTYRALVTEWCWIWTPSAVTLRREVIERHQVWFDSAHKVVGDYDFFLRFCRYGRIAYCDKPSARYHRTAGSYSSQFDRMWQGTLQAYRRLPPAPEHGLTQKDIDATVRKFCRWYHDLAVDAAAHGRWAEAGRYFRRALRYCPGIGADISWGRVTHPLYRLARPYVWVGYCGLRSLVVTAADPASGGGTS